MPTPDRDELLADLRRLRDEFDRLPSGATVSEHGRYPLRAYQQTFDTFPAALAAAGFDLPDFDVLPSDAELLHDLHRIFAELHKRPSKADLAEHGEWSKALYEKRWGTFTNALETAGFRTDRPAIPDAELIADVRRVADLVDGRPTRKQYTEHGRVTDRTIDNRVGWVNALVEAGLRDADEVTPTYSNQEILEDVARVWTELGHPPSASEMQEHGHVSPGTVAYRFGQWTTGRERVREEFDVP
jgi:hypothetical protein